MSRIPAPRYAAALLLALSAIAATPTPRPTPRTFPAKSPSVPAGTLTVEQPLLHYPFDQIQSGTPISSTGTAHADAVAEKVGPGHGHFAGAAEFNGQDSKMTIPYDLNRSVSDGITVAFWANVRPDFKGYANLVDTGGKNGLLVRFQGIKRLDLNAGGQWHVTGADTQDLITPGEWAHIAASFDCTTARLYVNGKQVAEQESPAQIKFEPRIMVGYGIERIKDESGAIKETENAFLPGLLDDLRIYGKALTPEQIAALARSPKP